MQSSTSKIWQLPLPKQFSAALTAISNVSAMQNFLRDVMTEKEIIEMSARLEAARLLSNGTRYTDISQQTKLSSRTIARISSWLENGSGGYKAALHHIPVSAGKRLR